MLPTDSAPAWRRAADQTAWSPARAPVWLAAGRAVGPDAVRADQTQAAPTGTPDQLELGGTPVGAVLAVAGGVDLRHSHALRDALIDDLGHELSRQGDDHPLDFARYVEQR